MFQENKQKSKCPHEMLSELWPVGGDSFYHTREAKLDSRLKWKFKLSSDPYLEMFS